MSQDFDLLLAGAGHAHLGVLRHWSEYGRPPGRIGLLSADTHAWYSGMLPGLLQGRYVLDDCRIALQPLCLAAGVEFICGQASALDAQAQRLEIAGAASLGYRLLSLNLGALPLLPAQHGNGMELLAVKPFGRFIQRWQHWHKQPQALAILGGGAAGVELALSLAPQLPTLSLFTAGQLLTGHPPALRRRALHHLARQGVVVQEHCSIDGVRDQHLLQHGQSVWQGTRAIVASGASALPWLHGSGLACDPRGFVQVNAQLQSTSHPQVFAVGDCASLAQTPHNGVYAVRQGPLLAHNLAAALQHRPLLQFRPQQRALALLASGDGGALASWGGLTAEGRLFGYWKDRLDRGFMRRHNPTGR